MVTSGNNTSTREIERPPRAAFGWNARWADLPGEVPDDRSWSGCPPRCVALVVAGPDRIVTAPLAERVEPEPTVGVLAAAKLA